VPYRRKKLTFAISFFDEFLLPILCSMFFGHVACIYCIIHACALMYCPGRML